jgi:threonine dehydrogenase-like Zn-dependent dehydrogenase
MATRARAAVLVGPRAIEVREFDLPGIGPDDALLRVEACGICGTDYEQYEGEVPPHEYYTPYPVVPGHEPLGVIAEIGHRARQRWGVDVGDRVAVRSGYGCGRCPACARWEPHACASRGGTYGFTDVRRPPALWGGYAEYLYLAPLSVVRRVDPTLPAEVAVLFNPLAAGLSWAVSTPGTRAGETVAILGPGQRGLCAVVAAREAGARCVIVTGLGRDARKLDLARELGADVTIDVDRDDPVGIVRDVTGGGADVVVDTTPYAPRSLAQAVAMAARRGRIVLAGLKGRRPTPDLFADDVIYKELTIRGVLSMPYADFERAVALLEARKYPLEKLHTHSFPVEQAAQAILTLAGRVPGAQAIHVAIVPGATSRSSG